MAGASGPTSATPIRDIIAKYSTYTGATVAVRGEISAFDTAFPSRSKFYVLRDTGAAILVEQLALVPNRDPGDPWRLEVAGPLIGQRVTVVGVVGYRQGADPPLFLREVHRIPYDAPLVPTTPTPTSTPGPTATPELTVSIPTATPVPVPPLVITPLQPGPVEPYPVWVWAVVGALALAVVMMLVLMLVLLTGRPAMLPQAPRSMEGHSVKVKVPPPGTYRVLPGYFEVVGDPAVRQVRLFQAPGEKTTEITFGREEGPSYFHVQLKPLTVSVRHAKVVVRNGSCTLINLSLTNPTRVNGVELAVEEACLLADGDSIEMGEVALVYHVG